MSSSTPPQPSSSSNHQSIYAFGSTYFYQLGGATPVELKHQNDDELDEPTVAAFHLTAPPWSNNNNNNNNNNTTASREDEVVIQDIQCTWTSSIFLTSKGKIYQTGTVHGKLTPTPRPIIIRLPLQVAQIAAGRHFCLAKMEGGLAVCSWGAGHFGQLGQGGKIALLQEPMVMERLLPHIIGAPIRQVAAGGWHGLAITTTGKLWAWGSNRRHQCGILPGSAIVNNSSNCDTSSEASLSSTVAYPQPIHCAADPNAMFSKVACGRAHSVALDEESGNVYCWGSSLYGQCGQSSRKTSVPSPKKVETLAQVHLVDVAAGEFHTLGLTGGGRVFSWGAGSEGQLGHGVSVTFGKPKLVGDLDFRSIMAGQDWKYHHLHSSMTGLHNTSMSSAADVSLRGATASTATTTDMPFDEGTNPNVLASNSESSKRPARRNSNNAFTPSPIVQQPKPKVGGTAAAAASVAASSVAASTEMGEGSEHSYTIDTLLPGPPLSVDGTTKSGESSSFAVPRITSIHASGSYSAAISSTGHLYTWGYNDVGMLGLPIPNHLVNIENMNPKTSSLRQLQGCSFDARHLVLLPRRVDALADVHVTGISTGPCHLWAWGTPRLPPPEEGDVEAQPTPSPLVGRTLYEVQETRRKKNLQRMRNTPSARALGGGAGAGTGTGVSTIQEDIYFDGGGSTTIVESPTYHQLAHHHQHHVARQGYNDSAGAIHGSPTKIAASLAAGGSTHSSTRSAPVGSSSAAAAAAHVDDNDHSVSTSPEKESWRFSMGVGKVLRRFSNPRGNSFIEPKERRPASRLRTTRFKEDVTGGGGIPALPATTTTTNDASTGAAHPTTTTTTVTSAASVGSAASVQTDNTPSKFLSRRQARSRSQPPTSRSRSASRTTVSLGSRYRKNRKAQPPSLATDDDGGKSATEATTAAEEVTQSQQERRTNKKASSKATV